MKRRGKYGTDHSKLGRLKRTWNGILFHSQAEARYAAKLDLLHRAGKIRHWSRQVTYEVADGVRYIADFVVFPNTGGAEVYEIKGVSTAAWKIKAKLFRTRFPFIPLIEVDAKTLQPRISQRHGRRKKTLAQKTPK